MSTQHPTWRLWTSAHPDYDYSYCTRTGRTHPDDERLHEVLATTVRVNAEMQVARYGSGMFAARIEDEPVAPARSKRKPHNHLAGYVCERVHPAGGHLVLYDAPLQGLDASDGRWVVVWEGCPFHGGGANIGPGHSSQREAREFLKVEASGVAFWDWDGVYSDGTLSD